MNATIASFNNLNRLREISTVVAKHGFGEFFERASVFQSLGFRPRETSDTVRRTPGRRLRLLLTELGPTYVKLGQVLSTRADLLSQDVIRELSELQDQVPPFPFEQVRVQIEHGLGRTIEDAFSEFNPQPLASASIAQAHRAKTKAGVEVIVKVQRPNIRERIRADLELLYTLARFLESIVELTSLTSPTAVVEEFEQAILGELDFTRERANLNTFRKANEGRPYVVVPHVVEHLSCETVLTLEQLEGPKITEFDPERHDRQVVVRNLIELSFVQMFNDGLFHGDPHPGNLLVLDRNRIGLIDLGLVGRLTRPMQETLIVMCLAVALKDASTLARLLYKVGISHDRVSLAELTADIQTVLDRYLGQDLSNIDSKSLLGDLLDLTQKYRIRIPREYAVLAKAAITIEGVVRKLSPELDVLEMALPYAQRLLYDRLNPATKDASARRMLLQIQGFANDIPAQLAQVLMDLEGGKLNITNRAAESQLTQLVAAVRLLAVTVFTSAIALGAVYWITHTGLTNQLALGLLWGSVVAFVAAFGWLVLGIRPRKIRWRK
jgi:ubiquinone biosynthesis protein